MKQIYVASMYFIGSGNTDEECYEDAFKKAVKHMNADTVWSFDFVEDFNDTDASFMAITNDK